MELSWRQLDNPPNMDRMLSDYREKLTNENPGCEYIDIQSGQWRGFEGIVNSVFTSRYGKYFITGKCLLEIVFIWQDGKRNTELEKNILKNFTETELIDGQYARWKCFGLDITVPASMLLQSCKVTPGYANMVFFEEGKYRNRAEFCRMGMVPYWLKTTLKEWMMARVSKGIKIKSYGSVVVSGHIIETITGDKSFRSIPFLSKNIPDYKISAWICPSDKRLYYTVSNNPARISGQKLFCCSEFAAESLKYRILKFEN